MATRTKRSISLPPELSDAIDYAASVDGTTPSAWLADAARRRLIAEQGVTDLDAWLESNGGPATADELDRAAAIVRRAVRS